MKESRRIGAAIELHLPGYMIHDLRYAARALRGSPGLVAVAVLSLGLGIGVNTTLFGVFNAVFLRQVSASDPGGVWRIWPGGSRVRFHKQGFGTGLFYRLISGFVIDAAGRRHESDETLYDQTTH